MKEIKVSNVAENIVNPRKKLIANEIIANVCAGSVTLILGGVFLGPFGLVAAGAICFLNIWANIKKTKKEMLKIQAKVVEELNTISYKLQGENIYVSAEGLKNAKIKRFTTKQTEKNKEEKIKRVTTYNDIYMLDKENRIRILKEISTELKDSKGKTETEQVYLLDNKETDDLIKENVEGQEIVLKKSMKKSYTTYL